MSKRIDLRPPWLDAWALPVSMGKETGDVGNRVSRVCRLRRSQVSLRLGTAISVFPGLFHFVERKVEDVSLTAKFLESQIAPSHE